MIFKKSHASTYAELTQEVIKTQSVLLNLKNNLEEIQIFQNSLNTLTDYQIDDLTSRIEILKKVSSAEKTQYEILSDFSQLKNNVRIIETKLNKLIKELPVSKSLSESEIRFVLETDNKSDDSIIFSFIKEGKLIQEYAFHGIKSGKTQETRVSIDTSF
ncbi:MAG: hypothetical protein K8R67_13770 [Desulfobacteraceae bacterium]|nr:hypothetical protein [Desulfobacteraceae bacterium]